MLKIEDLCVEVEGRQVLFGVNLEIPNGETHILFGPNGSGKSSLISTIIGIPRFKITKGRIIFDGKDISNLKINERAKIGIKVGFQNPPEIRGVRLKKLIEIYNASPQEILKKVFLPLEFADRELNVGFSGGEKKRAELAQIFASSPKMIILDEIDSGIDIESLELIGKELAKFISEKKCSALIVTHYGYVMKYLKPNKAHVMIKGRIACHGDPNKIWEQIRERGYGWCEKCMGKLM